MSMQSTIDADNSFGDKALSTGNFKHTLNTFLFEKINSLTETWYINKTWYIGILGLVHFLCVISFAVAYI